MLEVSQYCPSNYTRVIVTKTVWNWYKSRHVDQEIRRFINKPTQLQPLDL
jgi:hypothetical protein